MTRLFSIVIFGLLFINNIHAAYIRNYPISLTQPDNSTIDCFISGDVFYRRLHDADGYTIVLDSVTGYYKYALKESGKLLPSQYVVGQVNPKQVGLVQNLVDDKLSDSFYDYYQMSLIEHQSKYKQKYEDITLGPQTINNLVVFIRFADDNNFTDNIVRYENMFNCTDNDCNSMYNYYKQVSYSQLEINSYFYPTQNQSTILSYRDSKTRSYYQPYSTKNANGYQDNNESRLREHTLLKNAIEHIKSSIPSNLNLDYNNDGLVDNVCFIVKGDADDWGNMLWPHRWMLYSFETKINGKYVYDYNFQLENMLSYNSLGVGVLCHEMFHTLGAPDLYHYNEDYKDLISIGVWDIMDRTTNPPQSMGAYMKMRYGKWIPSIPEITKTGQYYVKPISSSTNNAYMIASPKSSNEYFVVEYRKNNGLFDGQLPGSGLLIYRVNKNGSGYGNMSYPDKPDELYIYRPKGTISDNGYIDYAFFSDKTIRQEFHNASNPACFLSDGTPADINISNIRITDTAAFFNVNFTDIPITDFSSNYTIIKEGESVNFKDLTSGLPTAWEWTFPGATPNTSNIQNPQNIKYNNTGTYNVSLKTTNNRGSNTNTKNAYIKVVPPNKALNCDNSIELSNGISISSNNIGGTNNINNYSCAPNIDHTGKEIVYSINTTIKADIEVKLDITGNCNLDLLAFNNCSEANCIAYSDDGLIKLNNANTGTYYFVVDGQSGDACAYSIVANIKEKDSLMCSIAQNLLQGYTYQSSTLNSSNNINSYNCDTSSYMTGNERIFKIDVSELSTIKINITQNSCSLKIYLFDACNLNSCIAYGDGFLKYYNAPKGIYYVVVDGYNQSNCDFSIAYSTYIDTVYHSNALEPICNQTIKGNTNLNGINYIEKYSCSDAILTGEEDVYVVKLTKQSDITATLISDTSLLEVFILEGTSANKCLSMGYYEDDGITKKAILKNAPANTYYVVVDGRNNYSGAYELSVNYPLFDYSKLSDTIICKGDTISLEVYGGNSYIWNTGDTINYIKTKPTTNTTYTLSIINNECLATEEMKVNIIDLTVYVADTIQVCKNSDYHINLKFDDLTGDFIKLIHPQVEFFEFAIALFGYPSNASYISGEIKYIQDFDGSYTGCSANGYSPNAFSNSIALIDRGDCFFSYKAYMAQIAGAKAVIIVNNEFGNNILSMAAGNYADLLNIPVIMIGNNDGNTLKNIILHSDSTQIVLGFNGYPKTFNWIPKDNINNPNIANPIININSNTAYTVEIQSMSCKSEKNIYLQVNENNLIVDAGGNKTINQGDITTLTASDADKYTWSNGANSKSIDISPLFNTTYSLSVSDGVCDASTSVEVTVKRNINDTFVVIPPSWYYTCSDYYTVNYIEGIYPIDTGFINGNNMLGDLEKAHKITVDSKNAWLDTVTVYIQYKEQRTNEDVFVCLYEMDPQTKGPKDNYFAKSLPIKLNDIDTSSAHFYRNHFYFEQQVKIPETFFVSVVLPQDTFFGAGSNKIAILSTLNGCSLSDSTAWEKWNNNVWASINRAWNINIDFAITAKINFKDTCFAKTDNNASLCGDNPISICATGGNYYSWDNGQIAECINVKPSITTTYNVTVFYGYCFATDNIVVNVNTTNLIDDVTLCNEQQMSIYAEHAEKYTWSNGDTMPYITINPNQGVTKYTITTSRNDCVSSDEVNVTKIIIPTNNAGVDQTICVGEKITLTATDGQTYTWNTGDTTNSITTSPKYTTEYKVTTQNQICFQTDTVIITVNPLPVIYLGADRTIASGKNTIITASGGDTYSWSTGIDNKILVVKPTTQSTYTVTVELSGCSATDQIIIYITSIDEINQNYKEIIKMYPNPADDYITLEISGNYKADIKIIDNIGKEEMCKTIDPEDNKINVKRLSRGYYTIQIIINNQIVSMPFIKN